MSRWTRSLSRPTRRLGIALAAGCLLLLVAGRLREKSWSLTNVKAERPHLSGIQVGVFPANLSSSVDAHARLQVTVLRPEEYKFHGVMKEYRGSLTVGVPTIEREGGSDYLANTLRSLLFNRTPAGRQDVIIVVMLADLDVRARGRVATRVWEEFSADMESGLIVLLEVAASVYPPLTGLKRNFHDEAARVSWRSKQVCDFAFMFAATKDLSQYFMMIEDDVYSAPNYYHKIVQFINSQKNPWVTLSVSELGFIGKIYHSASLEDLARFFLTFYDSMPVDYLFIHYNHIMSPKVGILLRKPTLFQHFGERSSLFLSKNDKPNKLKDKYFIGDKEISLADEMSKMTNPPAIIFTNIEVYKSNDAIHAYNAKNGVWFWGKSQKDGDMFSITFDSPVEITRVRIETGQELDKRDMIWQGVFELSPSLTHPGLHFTHNDHPECESWTSFGHFEHGLFDKNVSAAGTVRCARIRVIQDHESWLLINNIVIWTKANG